VATTQGSTHPLSQQIASMAFSFLPLDSNQIGLSGIYAGEYGINNRLSRQKKQQKLTNATNVRHMTGHRALIAATVFQWKT